MGLDVFLDNATERHYKQAPRAIVSPESGDDELEVLLYNGGEKKNHNKQNRKAGKI